MNPHATPRPFPGRSIGPSSLQQHQFQQSQQNQQPQPQQQQRQPLAPQVSANEEYASISDEDREHIDEVFDLMDMKKKGWLNSYEFKHSLAALGFDLSKPEYFRELQSYGSVPPDWHDQQSCPVNRYYVYLDQFRLCAAKLIANRDPREEAAKVFAMFDYDQDGFISVEDLRHLAQEIKDERTLSDEEIQSMIDHLDHDGKGGVSLDEFMQMMEEAG
ncbi:Calcium-binding component of the spindle pole body (SPB) half-bridge [Metarhizium acridum]|uniref:Centrin n=1 Tax=Metarhizium acridum (strain CQMa 102) TaxID=655827 RepID=E9E0M9_METAQ|nr:centrin [Metarhizium acridum CQMa 102]EFY90433.1 centrin [Metarhizium acridum CQMa 102]KAG8423864.1 Calcium-binding component of the spindle pole body (SPB) half-bridge [Metarhizium acridum]